jgi:hypothetical protein
MMGFLSYGLGGTLIAFALFAFVVMSSSGHHAEEAHRPAQFPGSGTCVISSRSRASISGSTSS